MHIHQGKRLLHRGGELIKVKHRIWLLTNFTHF